RSRTIMMMAGMAGAGFFLSLVVAACVGIPRAVFDQISQAFPARKVMVQATAIDFSLLRLDQGIDAATFRELSGLRGVAAAHPIEPLRIPSSLQGSLLDITLQTDVIVWGVPPEMVELDTRHPKLEFEATAWERGRSL